MMYSAPPPPQHMMAHQNSNNSNLTYPSPPQPIYVQPMSKQQEHHTMTPPQPQPQQHPIHSPSSEFDSNLKNDKRPNLRVQIPNESPEPASFQPQHSSTQPQPQLQQQVKNFFSFYPFQILCTQLGKFIDSAIIHNR